MNNLVTRTRQKGLTLLEILITIVILSVGILGVAALQLKGSQFNQSAFLRSQAAFLAYDILDRMRANKGNATSASTGYLTNYGSGAITASTNCASSDCTAAQMATYDLSQWKQSIFSTLPGGDGNITVDDTTAPRVYTIAIRWQDSRSTSTPQEFRFRAEL